jgi:COP9 signalosome complex subunit 3
MDSVLHLITTADSIEVLNYNLRTALAREIRNTVLASMLASGQDPLSVLDMRANTLGILYIL